MFKYVYKYLGMFCIATFVLACSHNNKPIIKFSTDCSSIIIKNIDEGSLLQAKNISLANSDSAGLVSVFLRPDDSDSLQDEIPVSGKTTVSGDSVVFVPHSTFVVGKTYLVENYVGIKFAPVGNLLNGTAKHNLQPQKQVLVR
ncbi:hypothetical protein [Pedobacter sandarakinus]|uniref:hypothetical protein n=1 Tax=Pedobacter sandarakinus TaxID=353156 RepID=UPI002247D50E|nr:hypothetical protein [Pedobacter sandarakinus]MCX2573435.1 hypothetical protein [Pedobacter sandarakinus]